MSSADETSDSSWEEFLYSYRIPITVILIGLIMIGIAFLFYKDEQKRGDDIQVIETKEEVTANETFVEVAGAVENPGVYGFEANSRIEDALVAVGGLSAEADRE